MFLRLRRHHGNALSVVAAEPGGFVQEVSGAVVPVLASGLLSSSRACGGWVAGGFDGLRQQSQMRAAEPGSKGVGVLPRPAFLIGYCPSSGVGDSCGPETSDEATMVLLQSLVNGFPFVLFSGSDGSGADQIAFKSKPSRT